MQAMAQSRGASAPGLGRTIAGGRSRAEFDGEIGEIGEIAGETQKSRRRSKVGRNEITLRKAIARVRKRS